GITAIIVLLVWRLIDISIVSWEYILSGIAVLNGALAPVYIGLVIAYLLDPVMMRLEEYVFLPLSKKIWKQKKAGKAAARGLSVFVSIVFGIFLIIGLFMLVLPEIINSLTSLVNNMPSYYRVLQEWIAKLNKNHPELANYALELSKQAYNQLRNWLSNELIPSSTEILATVSGSVVSVLVQVFDWFIGLIVSIYLLANKEMFLAQARRLIYSIFSVKRAGQILSLTGEMNQLFSKFISGKILDSLCVGIITFFVMSILGIPYTSLISVIIGVTNIIPFFGQYIGIVPSAFLILLVSPFKCIIFLIAIIIIMQIDGNIIGPKILGESIGLGSFWILFSILVFGSLFGIIGMIVAVPLFALAYRNVKRWSKERLEKKQLPTETNYYRAEKVEEHKREWLRRRKEKKED
ncbi:MAG: AI-2E family transporter, partial [Lachnospiraceae bacterium]|nr:AI-2E family transporter [Lachnospiraceae bacterium]